MINRNRFLRYKLNFIDGADNADGGTPGSTDDNVGGDGAEGSQGVSVEQFNQLVNTVGTLAQGMQSLQQTIQQTAVQQSMDNNSDDEDEQEDIGNDLEVLSRAEFAQHITNVLSKQFKSQIEEIAKQINEIRTGVQEVDTKTTIKEFAAQHKDFWDWQDELRAIVKETPGISIERAYKLARAENPKKARELDEKYNPSEVGKKRQAFGGLTPTSGRTAKSTKMSAKDAAEAAWEQTMADLEAALSNENV